MEIIFPPHGIKINPCSSYFCFIFILCILEFGQELIETNEKLVIELEQQHLERKRFEKEYREMKEEILTFLQRENCVKKKFCNDCNDFSLINDTLMALKGANDDSEEYEVSMEDICNGLRLFQKELRMERKLASKEREDRNETPNGSRKMSLLARKNSMGLASPCLGSSSPTVNAHQIEVDLLRDKVAELTIKLAAKPIVVRSIVHDSSERDNSASLTPKYSTINFLTKTESAIRITKPKNVNVLPSIQLDQEILDSSFTHEDAQCDDSNFEDKDTSTILNSSNPMELLSEIRNDERGHSHRISLLEDISTEIETSGLLKEIANDFAHYNNSFKSELNDSKIDLGSYRNESFCVFPDKSCETETFQTDKKLGDCNLSETSIVERVFSIFSLIGYFRIFC